MALGSLTMTCLLLVPGQAPTDVSYLNQRAMKIPIDIKSTRRQDIKEVILYVSADRGRSWEKNASERPDKGYFEFRAPADGEYWFRIAAINLQGNQEPENIAAGPPDQKTIIDTFRKPSLRIVSAQRDGEYLVVKWGADSPLPPDPASMKLEYRMLDGFASVWENIPVQPQPTGDARARLATSGAVAVRMQFRDMAGNVALKEVEVPGIGGARTIANSSPAGQLPLPGQAPVGSSKDPRDALPPPPVVMNAPKPVDPPRVAQVSSVASDVGSPVSSPKMTLPPAPIPETTGRTGNRSPDHAPTPMHSPERDPVATTTQQAQVGHQPNPPAPAAPVQHTDPQVRLVNSREVALEYQLSRLGPSGIGSVVLYMTSDGGKQWTAFEDEKPDLTRPTIGSKYQRTLTLPPEEGVYGLILVVQNKGGIGRPKPKPGDAPEMVIEVDMTPPYAKLWGPQPDPERRDAVVLKWTAQDKNMPANPVALEWAEKPDGPWRTIATNLPGSGTHSWQVPEGMPVAVYLRLRVHDSAGNEAVAVTNAPQTIDLVPPEGHLVGVRAVQRP